jgi:GTP-binding protein HflX
VSPADLPPNSVAISALTEEGLPELVGLIERVLAEELVDLYALIPYRNGELVALLHQRGVVEREEHTAEGTIVQGRIPADLVGRYRAFSLGGTDSEEV